MIAAFLQQFDFDSVRVPTDCVCPTGIPGTDCSSPGEEKCVTQDCICRNGTPDRTNYCTTFGEVKCDSCYEGWTGSDCETPITCTCPNGIPLTHCAFENEVRCLSCNMGWSGSDCNTQIASNSCICPNGTPSSGCNKIFNFHCKKI